MALLLQQVNNYLHTHFLTFNQLCDESKTPSQQILKLVEHQCIPTYSYEVKRSITIHNVVFGESPLEEDHERFYAKALVPLVLKAQHLAQSMPLTEVAKNMKDWIQTEYQKKFQSTQEAQVAFPVCFLEDGSLEIAHFQKYFEEVFQDWLQGIHGICVIDSSSPSTIATKEIFQAYLKKLTEDGAKIKFTQEEQAHITRAIATYRQVAMPFSPHEYPCSSRKRLIDDISVRLGSLV